MLSTGGEGGYAHYSAAKVTKTTKYRKYWVCETLISPEQLQLQNIIFVQ